MFLSTTFKRRIKGYMAEQGWYASNLHALQAEILQTQLLSTQKYSDPRRLEHFGYKAYSQNDEDGIIQEIFNRIGTTNRFFVEFGVQDGLESNTHFLLLQGWNGVFMEGSSEYVAQIQEKFASPISEGRLKVMNAFITRENINDLMQENGAAKIDEIDLLSIDIDGNDYYIFEAIECIHPRVIVVEYNAKFPPPARWIMPYNKEHVWDGTDRQGASLQALADLGEKKGYRLVATNLNGINAFFVRNDLIDSNLFALQSPKELYNPMRLMSFRSGHPTREYLGNHALNFE